MTKNFFLITKHCLSILLQVAIILVVCTCGYGKMKEMKDSEMSEITGGGFSSVQLINDGVNDIARMQFNVQVDTYAEIGSLKMGYWNNGNGLGWDQNWTTVKMGSTTYDLKLKGFIFEAKFTDLDDPSHRELEEVRIGFRDVVGTLQANFQSLSRVGALPRQAQGVKTYSFNHDPFIIIIKCRGSDSGIWFDFGGAQGN